MKINYKLYHFSLCPFSRKVKIFLAEKSIEVDTAHENFWEKREDFIRMNPTGEVPVLLSYDSDLTIVGSNNICQYLEEVYGGIKYFGNNIADKVEINRLIDWFDLKFFNEVSKYFLYEQVIKYYSNSGSPEPSYLRAGAMNLSNHLAYMEQLLSKRKWLAGGKFSLADITASSHLSIIDYLGAIDWENYPITKEYYSLIKSRPSFTQILDDKLLAFEPAEHYKNLDF